MARNGANVKRIAHMIQGDRPTRGRAKWRWRMNEFAIPCREVAGGPTLAGGNNVLSTTAASIPPLFGRQSCFTPNSSYGGALGMAATGCAFDVSTDFTMINALDFPAFVGAASSVLWELNNGASTDALSMFYNYTLGPCLITYKGGVETDNFGLGAEFVDVRTKGPVVLVAQFHYVGADTYHVSSYIYDPTATLIQSFIDIAINVGPHSSLYAGIGVGMSYNRGFAMVGGQKYGETRAYETLLTDGERLAEVVSIIGA
jgi:hypothetical protein